MSKSILSNGPRSRNCPEISEIRILVQSSSAFSKGEMRISFVPGFDVAAFAVNPKFENRKLSTVHPSDRLMYSASVPWVQDKGEPQSGRLMRMSSAFQLTEISAERI